jgi:hypothetical protein
VKLKDIVTTKVEPAVFVGMVGGAGLLPLIWLVNNIVVSLSYIALSAAWTIYTWKKLGVREFSVMEAIGVLRRTKPHES